MMIEHFLTCYLFICCFVYDAITSLDCIAFNAAMIDDWWVIKWKGLKANWYNWCTLLKFVWRVWGINLKAWFRMLITMTGIRKKRFSNTSQKHEQMCWVGVCSSWRVWSSRADLPSSVSRGNTWIIQCGGHLLLQLFRGLCQCEEQERNWFTLSSHLSRVWSKNRYVMLNIPGWEHHHSIYACAKWRPSYTSPSKWVKKILWYA